MGNLFNKIENVSAFCPYCHKEVAFSWVIINQHGGELTHCFDEHYKTNTGVWSLAQCPSCQNCILVKADYLTAQSKWGIMQVSPLPLPSQTDIRIPDEIKKALNEAKLCLSVEAPMASSAMSRRAMQSACLHQGATEEKLEKQIDELYTKGIITAQIKDWAHSVRLVGNDGAHPKNKEVIKEDAKDALDLAEQLAHILYVMPAIAQKQKESHSNKKIS